MGTGRLLQATLAYWAELPIERQREFRFLHVSTDEVYGDLAATDPAFRETTAYAPSSPYAATKAGSDHLVRAWSRTYKLPVLVDELLEQLRSVPVSREADPAHDPERSARRAFARFMGTVVRFGIGCTSTTTRARSGLCSTRGKTGETYNIGGHNEQRNIDVVRQICRILDSAAATTRAEERLRVVDHVRHRSAGARSSLRDRCQQDRRRPSGGGR